MLPVETVEALFPSSGVVGKLTLRPMTLGHAVLLYALGIDPTQGVTVDTVLTFAWVLSLSNDETKKIVTANDRVPFFKAWCEKYNPDLYELAETVCKMVSSAYSTFVPPSADDKVQTVFSSESGFGWPLEIAECLCHEYGMKVCEAVDTPIATAYGLICAARQRNGGKNGGPDYYERIAMKKAADEFRKAKEAKEEKESRQNG